MGLGSTGLVGDPGRSRERSLSSWARLRASTTARRSTPRFLRPARRKRRRRCSRRRARSAATRARLRASTTARRITPRFFLSEPCRGKGSREDHGGKRVHCCFWASLRSRIQQRTLIKVHTPSDIVAWWNDGACCFRRAVSVTTFGTVGVVRRPVATTPLTERRSKVEVCSWLHREGKVGDPGEGDPRKSGRPSKVDRDQGAEGWEA